MKELKGVTYDIIRYETERDFARGITFSSHDEIKIDTDFGFVIINAEEDIIAFEIEIYVRPNVNFDDKDLIQKTNKIIFQSLQRGNKRR